MGWYKCVRSQTRRAQERRLLYGSSWSLTEMIAAAKRVMGVSQKAERESRLTGRSLSQVSLLKQPCILAAHEAEVSGSIPDQGRSGLQGEFYTSLGYYL